MKVEIIIDESLDETSVKIFAKEYSKEIENLRNMLEGNPIDKVVAFRDEEVFILSFDEIIRIYAEDKNVFVKTKSGIYKSRLNVSEFEARLDKKT